MIDKLNIGATMTLELVRNGQVVETRTIHNKVVNGGFDLVCDMLGNTTRPARLGYVAIGTGTATTSDSATALGTQWGSRVATTYAHTAGTKLLSLSCVIPAHTGATVSISESGLFTASTGGIMFDRVTFTAIQKAAEDTINIRYVINLAEGT